MATLKVFLADGRGMSRQMRFALPREQHITRLLGHGFRDFTIRILAKKEFNSETRLPCG